jgi:hypothetical protein
VPPRGLRFLWRPRPFLLGRGRRKPAALLPQIPPVNSPPLLQVARPLGPRASGSIPPAQRVYGNMSSTMIRAAAGRRRGWGSEPPCRTFSNSASASGGMTQRGLGGQQVRGVDGAQLAAVDPGADLVLGHAIAARDVGRGEARGVAALPPLAAGGHGEDVLSGAGSAAHGSLALLGERPGAMLTRGWV